MSRYQNRYDNAYYNHLDGGPRKKAGGSIFLVVVLLFLTMGGIFNIKDEMEYNYWRAARARYDVLDWGPAELEEAGETESVWRLSLRMKNVGPQDGNLSGYQFSVEDAFGNNGEVQLVPVLQPADGEDPEVWMPAGRENQVQLRLTLPAGATEANVTLDSGEYYGTVTVELPQS